jgi:ArsR family transcriptional regulator
MVSSAQKKRDRKAAHLFKLVASPTRVSILSVIADRKELAVQDIAENLGMTHSAVSHQLSLLSDAGIVASRKDGRNMYYSLGKSAGAKALMRFIGAVS